MPFSVRIITIFLLFAYSRRPPAIASNCITDVWLTGWLASHFGTRTKPYRVIGPTGAKRLMENLERAYADDIKIRHADEKFPLSGIATDVTGIPEIIRSGASGLIIGQHRPDQIADGIVRVLADPAVATTWAAAARDRVSRDFDLHRNAADLRAIFRGAIAPATIGAQ